jgi:formylglycine-generating enzyme required for sulfatase activity
MVPAAILRPVGRAALGAALLLGAGCGSPDAGVSVGGGGAGGGLSSAVGEATSPYLILDLVAGTARSAAAIDDLATNPAWRTTALVFHRVHGLGDDYFLAVFETTQEQWTRLGGAQPWTAVPSAVVGSDAVAADHPAFALSYADVQTVLGAYAGAHHAHLAVPSTAQWRFACAAGSAGAYSWGDATDRATVAANAVVAETLGGAPGPRSVGALSANGAGFYDMHGNVWEWTSPGTSVSGGSWHDGLARATTQGQAGFADAQITDLTAHALIGVRLVLQP